MIMTVLAGFAGGLAGTLWAGTVSSALLARRPELGAAGWRPDTAWRVLHTAVLYGLCGAAAGLLFWLGWGLVAFTAVALVRGRRQLRAAALARVGQCRRCCCSRCGCRRCGRPAQ